MTKLLSAGTMTKFSWRRKSCLTSSGSQKIDSCLVLRERLSLQILRFRKSAIDLTHSERVSTSTSPFLAYRLAYSSYASMMVLKFWCHETETESLYFGPLRKTFSVFGYGRYWDHLSLYGHMERIEIQNHSRNKVWDSWKDHRSLFAADLLCNWKCWKQPNGYSYKKCKATPGIENMEGVLLWTDFWFNMLLKFKASMPLLANLTFIKGRFLVSEGSPPWQLWKVCLRKYPKWYPEVDALQMQRQ